MEVMNSILFRMPQQTRPILPPSLNAVLLSIKKSTTKNRIFFTSLLKVQIVPLIPMKISIVIIIIIIIIYYLTGEIIIRE